MKPKFIINFGRAISLLWVGFWSWFIISVLTSERFPVDGLVHGGIPLALALIATSVAWRWNRIGGALLVLEGLTLASIMASGYLHPNSPSAALFMVLTLVAPPIASGLLFLDGWWRGRSPLPAA